MNEEYQQDYASSLSEYLKALRSISDLLTEPSGLDEIKMRIIIEEEANNFEKLSSARIAWLEARDKYFNL